MTPAQLAAAIAALPGLRPAERATAAKELIEDAKGVLSEVRYEAIAQMLDSGMTYPQAAAELGVSEAAINAAVIAYRTRHPGQPSRRSRSRARPKAGGQGDGQHR